MPKGNRRPIGVMAQGAVSQQKDSEIESLKEQIEQLKASKSVGDVASEIPVNQVTPLKIESKNGRLELIQQPRTYFEPQGLEDLAKSIQENGLREPVIVRRLADGNYGLLDGERRWRCHVSLGKEAIRATVVPDISDDAALEWAITTDTLKEKISPLEQTISVINLLRLRLHQDEARIRSMLHALNNYDIGNSGSVDLEEEVTTVISGVLNSLGLKLGSLVARLPLLDMPGYLRLAVEEGRLSPTNALLINRAPEALHSQLLDKAETHSLSKTKLTQLISQLKSKRPFDSTEGRGSNQSQQGSHESDESLPVVVGKRWNRVRQLAAIKQGTNTKLNRKLRKIEQLLSEIESMASE